MPPSHRPKPKPRAKRTLLGLRTLRCLALSLACTVAAGLDASAQTQAAPSGAPIEIAVFDFELRDMSAGAGIVPQDPQDVSHLAQSTQEVRKLLEGSGDYALIETGDAKTEILAAGGLQNCRGCEAAVAARLGAEQSLAGVVTRVNRTEYTVQIVIRDTATGKALANHFTGLRMGANYAWSRGARSLVRSGVLAQP